MQERQLEQTVNYRTPEWRQEMIALFKQMVLATLTDMMVSVGDVDFEIKGFHEWYHPKITDAYFLQCEIFSKKLQLFTVDWNPLTAEFERTHIIVRYEYQHQGLATRATEVTEAIARKLGAKILKIGPILETSVAYWQQRPDYELTPQFYAVKYLS